MNNINVISTVVWQIASQTFNVLILGMLGYVKQGTMDHCMYHPVFLSLQSFTYKQPFLLRWSLTFSLTTMPLKLSFLQDRGNIS